MGFKKNISILVVDDHKATRMLMGGVLENLGFDNIILAADGAEGLRVIKEHQVSLIFSDWNMAPMNGYDFLCAVKKINKDIPFIMVTAEDSMDNFNMAVKTGVDNYILKPFNSAVIKKKIMSVLKINL